MRIATGHSAPAAAAFAVLTSVGPARIDPSSAACRLDSIGLRILRELRARRKAFVVIDLTGVTLRASSR